MHRSCGISRKYDSGGLTWRSCDAVCGSTHRESYIDGDGQIVALAVTIVLGLMLRSLLMSAASASQSNAMPVTGQQHPTISSGSIEGLAGLTAKPCQLISNA
jgi:hypothetical protein